MVKNARRLVGACLLVLASKRLAHALSGRQHGRASTLQCLAAVDTGHG